MSQARRIKQEGVQAAPMKPLLVCNGRVCCRSFVGGSRLLGHSTNGRPGQRQSGADDAKGRRDGQRDGASDEAHGSSDEVSPFGVPRNVFAYGLGLGDDIPAQVFGVFANVRSHISGV